MTPLFIIAGVAGLPVVAAIVFRVNAMYLFISIAVGYLLVQFIGDTAGLTAASIITAGSTEIVTKLALFGAPIVLTITLLRKTLPKKQFLFQVIPLIGDGLVILVLSLPLFSQSVQTSIKSNQIGHTIYQATDVTVAVVAMVHLGMMFLFGKPPSDGGKKHH